VTKVTFFFAAAAQTHGGGKFFSRSGSGRVPNMQAKQCVVGKDKCVTLSVNTEDTQVMIG
jgi:hypothetical protein